MQYWVHDNNPNHPDSMDSQSLFELLIAYKGNGEKSLTGH